MTIAPPESKSPIYSDTVLFRGHVVPVDVLGQREVDARFAGIVRQLAGDVPEALPRMHAHADRASGAGLRHLAPEGAYSRIRAVTRQEWLAGVDVVLARSVDVLRRHCVSAATMQTWAASKALYACQRTGRGCIVRPSTLASVMGMRERQAQRCNAVARELGIEALVCQGRMLDVDERAAAQATGSRQRGFASEVALTLPRDVVVDVPLADRNNRCLSTRSVDSDTPSRGPQKPIKVRKIEKLSAAASVGSIPTETPPASPLTKEDSGRRRGGRDSKATTLAVQLIEQIPWLVDEQIGRIAPCLTRFAAAEWTAKDVLDALQTAAQRRGKADPLRMVRDDVRTRPAAFLAFLLRPLDVVNDWPCLGRMFPEETGEICRNPECDHGWITQPDGRVRRCIDCPAHIHHMDHTVSSLDPFENDGSSKGSF